METYYDIIGIGIGPFNLGMAALCDGIKELNCLFLDKKPDFDWHPGIMIPGSTMQVSFLADLVTLADPSSRYSYLKFLNQRGRLLQFGIYEKNYITRSEYNRYCKWVCQQLSSLKFGYLVDEIKYDTAKKVYCVYCKTGKGEINSFTAKNIVIGVGTQPKIPLFARCFSGEQVFHSSQYLEKREHLRAGSILLVGSGQSAAEIFYDQLNSPSINNKNLLWYTRSQGFLSMENTKFAYELSTPEYIDYFYNLPGANKKRILKLQDYFYKGINEGLVNAIYDILYERMLEQVNNNITMMANTEVSHINSKKKNKLKVRLYQTQQEREFYIDADWIILATGYESVRPKFIFNLCQHNSCKTGMGLKIDRNYSVRNLPGIYMQNAELESHGFSAADLSLGAYRNAVILNSILKCNYFNIEKKSTFQKFGI